MPSAKNSHTIAVMLLFEENTTCDPYLINDNEETVANLIPRILAQRASFLNITEEQMQKEIEDLEVNGLSVEGIEELNTSSFISSEPADPSIEATDDQIYEQESLQKKKTELFFKKEKKWKNK